MSIKNDVLKILNDANGKYVSGQQLGESLFCSRNAIWKAINSLKNDGFEIKSVTNKGYALIGNDVFSSVCIEKMLSCPAKIDVIKSASSTNDLVKAAAENGTDEGYCIIAAEQTKGKGRLGRSFFSPNSGIYMSILLRPVISPADSLMITTAAAVAVARAIDEVCGKHCEIKWVNDIFLNGLKICGILTEAAMDFESGRLQYAVLGIGVNLAHPKDDFPSELKGIAGAIFSEPQSNSIKNRLCAEIINNFFKFYSKLDKKEYMAEYKSRSLVIGRPIYVIKHDSEAKAIAIDIDDNARLIVEYEDGSKDAVSTGEISIRLQ